MDKNSKHIIRQIGESLRDVINKARGWHGQWNQDRELNFKRIIYRREYNLVTVEIEKRQFLGLPESFLATNFAKQTLLAISLCRKVDVMDLGKSIYVYVWLTPDEQNKVTREANLALAV